MGDSVDSLTNSLLDIFLQRNAQWMLPFVYIVLQVHSATYKMIDFAGY